MEEKEKNQEQQNMIDLGVLWHNLVPYLRRFWWLLLLLALLGGGLMFLRVWRSYTPMYRSEAVFSVSVSTSNNSDILSYSYYYDNAAANQAVSTFPYLLNSDVMRELICQKLGTGYINGNISASSVPSTNFFVLSVTSQDPNSAYDIAMAVMEIYPQIGQQVIGDIQLVVSQEPSVPDAPYNAFSWKSSAVKGALLAVLAGLAVLVLLASTRHTVLSSSDVKRMVNLPCLAHIPSVSVKQRKRSKAAGLLITRQEPDSAFSESFRLLRLKLLRALDADDKVIMFTSSVPSEGKSSIAANTALSLAK